MDLMFTKLWPYNNLKLIYTKLNLYLSCSYYLYLTLVCLKVPSFLILYCLRTWIWLTKDLNWSLEIYFNYMISYCPVEYLWYFFYSFTVISLIASNFNWSNIYYTYFWATLFTSWGSYAPLTIILIFCDQYYISLVKPSLTIFIAHMLCRTLSRGFVKYWSRFCLNGWNWSNCAIFDVLQQGICMNVHMLSTGTHI